MEFQKLRLESWRQDATVVGKILQQIINRYEWFNYFLSICLNSFSFFFFLNDMLHLICKASVANFARCLAQPLIPSHVETLPLISSHSLHVTNYFWLIRRKRQKEKFEMSLSSSKPLRKVILASKNSSKELPIYLFIQQEIF